MEKEGKEFKKLIDIKLLEKYYSSLCAEREDGKHYLSIQIMEKMMILEIYKALCTDPDDVDNGGECSKPVTTYEEREKIFSKDYLTIEDVEALLGLQYQDAARVIRNIKRKTDRLRIRGKIHVQDYLDYYNLSADRYVRPLDETENENLA